MRTYFDRAKNHSSAFLFTGASLMVSFASIIAGAFMLKIEPRDRGMWDLARTALPFAMLALVGINNGLSRDLPYYFGKSDSKTADKLAGTAQFYIAMAGLLVLLAGMGSIICCWGETPQKLFTFAAVTGLIMASFYTNYLIVTFRSAKSFQNFSKIKVVEAILTVATIPMIAYLGYAGMVSRTLVLSGVVLLCMHWMRPVRVLPKWDTSSFLLLMKTGAPIFVFDYLISNVSNCDKWVLLKFGGQDGLKMVGSFALATMAREAISKVPDALGEYIYPRMSHCYGEFHDPIRLWKMAIKASLMVMAFMVPAVAVSWFILPPVVSHFFPKYVDAVPAAQWILIGSIFSGATIGKLAIWSLKDWKIMAWYQVLNCVFIVAGPLGGALLGKDLLTGVSLGIVTSQMLWVPVAAYLVYLATHRKTAAPAN
ncbi:MAG: oligosaccharide flippase family protein [Verrucomicrobiota bacterium]